MTNPNPVARFPIDNPGNFRCVAMIPGDTSAAVIWTGKGFLTVETEEEDTGTGIATIELNTWNRPKKKEGTLYQVITPGRGHNNPISRLKLAWWALTGRITPAHRHILNHLTRKDEEQ